MNFDVVICTLNSAATIERCISGILKFVSTERIIVVDGGSSDGTLEILRNFPMVELHIRPDLNLGNSRKFAFELVKTEWFLQIDSDIILKKSLEESFERHHTKSDVIEFGTNNFYSFQTPTIRELESGAYEKRAFFFTNLIKKSSISAYDLDVRHMEEELMRRYMISDGKVWTKTGEIVSDHFSSPMRYEGREIALILRVKPYPRWVYYDMGKIDRLSRISLRGVLRSVLQVISYSLNLSGIMRVFLSLSNPIVNLYFYIAGYIKR